MRLLNKRKWIQPFSEPCAPQEFVVFCPKIQFSSWHFPTIITAHLSAVTFHSNRKLTLAVERESSQCGEVLAAKAVLHLAATQAFLMHVNTTIYNRSSDNPLELGHNCCATEGSPFIGFWILCHILHAKLHTTKPQLHTKLVLRIQTISNCSEKLAFCVFLKNNNSKTGISVVVECPAQQLLRKSSTNRTADHSTPFLTQLKCIRYNIVAHFHSTGSRKNTLDWKRQDSERFTAFPFLSYTNCVTKWH